MRSFGSEKIRVMEVGRAIVFPLLSARGNTFTVRRKVCYVKMQTFTSTQDLNLGCCCSEATKELKESEEIWAKIKEGSCSFIPPFAHLIYTFALCSLVI